MQRTVLNPASPLFREARYRLAAEAELHDMGLYHSVLAAIAAGNNTRGQLARHWTRYFAPEEITGGFPSRVEAGTVRDPAIKKNHQVDIAALGPDASDRESLPAIGEVTWHETMGLTHLDRLRHFADC